MENSKIEKKNILNIETTKGPKNGEVSYCAERGGIITSLKLKGKEILYLDEETFKNTDENVKGGIPILFPNAGPITESGGFPNLKQHGFARNSKWQTEKIENGFREMLSSNEETKKMYPYDFQFYFTGEFKEDGSFILNQEIENMRNDKDLPLSFGLHPYFKVSNKDKKNIRFNFEGGKKIEEQLEIWANGKAVSIDNPKLKNKDAVLEIEIPSLGKLTINPSTEYKKIWVWSMPEKDFVCVEPVMRDKDGLIDDPEKVKPNETLKASVIFKLD